MKVISRFAALLAVVMAVLPACGGDSADPAVREPLGDYSVPDLSRDIMIGYKQKVFVESEGLSLTFKDYSESRCPKGAVCVWEGEGMLDLVLENEAGETASALPVTRPGKDPERFAWMKAYALGYRITLLELEPYPDLSEKSQPGDYTALLRVERVLDQTGCDHVMFTQGDPLAMCRDELTIHGAAIDGIVLEVYVGYGGGCGSHEFMLLGRPYFKESYPAQIDLYVHHRNIDDYCDSVVADTLCFDIRRVSELYEGAYQSCDEILINILDCNMDDPSEEYQVVMRP